MAQKKKRNTYKINTTAILLIIVVLALASIFLVRAYFNSNDSALGANGTFNENAGKGSKTGSFSPTPTPALSITDDTVLPTVKITYPIDQSYHSTYVIGITADVSDNTGVSHVEFYVDNVLICIVTTTPYKCDYNIPPSNKAVQHIIKAVAYDLAHNSASDTVTINIYPLNRRK